MELTERLSAAIDGLERSVGLLQSRYFEALVARAIKEAVASTNSPWLDRAAAAAHCRCSESEVDRAAAAGVFQTFRRGGTPLFKRDELDAAIEAGKWKPRN